MKQWVRGYFTLRGSIVWPLMCGETDSSRIIISRFVYPRNAIEVCVHGLCKVEKRSHFFMPALAAYRYNPIIQALVTRLQQRGKSKMTIVGAAIRKLLHLAYGVLKTGQPFDPHYANHAVATT